MSRIGKFPWGQRLGKPSAGGGGAPSDAQYLVLAVDGTLTNERVATAGTGITFADAGAGSTLTISAKLSTGAAGGQSAIGGTAASENLTLSSTSHATKGKLIFGTSAYDEANNRLGIGTASPVSMIDVSAPAGVDGEMTLRADADRYCDVFFYHGGTDRWLFGMPPNDNNFIIQERTNTTSKMVLALGTEGAMQLVPTGGNLLIGTTTDVATTKVRLNASRSVASAAGAVWDAFDVIASTLTISGSTNITTATGVNLHVLRIPTLSAASALTVTNAATLYIEGAPAGAGAGPCTITNAYSLWIDAGSARFDGRILGASATAATGTTMTLGAANWNSTTGSTTVDFITTTGWTAGSVVYITIGSDVTFRHNIASPPANTAPLNLAGDANISPTAGDQITLLYTGSVWQQQTAVLAS